MTQSTAREETVGVADDHVPDETTVATGSSCALADTALSVLDDPIGDRGAVEEFDSEPSVAQDQSSGQPDAARVPLVRLVGMAAVLGLLAGTFVAIGTAVPQAVVAVALTACASMITFLFCQRSLVGLHEQASLELDHRPEPELEAREEAMREAALREIEKIRIFFETLLEKHVFRIHRDLRSKEAEIRRLEEQLVETESCDEAESPVDLAATSRPAPDTLAATDDAPEDEAVDEDAKGEPPESATEACGLGDWRPNPSTVNVREVARSVVERRRDGARERGIKLSARVPASVGCARTDSSALERILDELVDHALTRSPKKGTVTLSASRRDGRSGSAPVLCLRVKDGGRTPKDRSSFFDPGKSSAPGLAVVGRYVQALGGTIRVESGSGRGCAIVVELPGLARIIHELDHRKWCTSRKPSQG